MKPSGNKGNCLHLVVRSSVEALANCRTQLEEGDTVLFLDDGVMHILAEGRDALDAPFQESYFSAADLLARGVLPLLSDTSKALPDTEIAGLLLAHDFCLTWK